MPRDQCHPRASVPLSQRNRRLLAGLKKYEGCEELGAGNAIRVYHGWGRTLKDRPLRLMVYMALTARDNDAEPWFSLGLSTHETLAEMALGLRLPELTGDAVKDQAGRDAVLRKVRRHLTPLFTLGAIETTRRAVTTQHGSSPVVYRLYLDGPRADSPFPAYRT